MHEENGLEVSGSQCVDAAEKRDVGRTRSRDHATVSDVVKGRPPPNLGSIPVRGDSCRRNEKKGPGALYDAKKCIEHQQKPATA